MALAENFVSKQGFGFRWEHLGYKNSIVPQGNFLIKKEVRCFQGYFLNLPIFEKHEIAEAACPRVESGGGGVSTLHLKNEYKIFGKTIFTTHRQKAIGHPFHFYYKYYHHNSLQGWDDCWDIGKYVATNPNINDEIFELCRGLNAKNQEWLLRQIARVRKCYENKIANFTELDDCEIKEIEQVFTEFLPNIHKLSDSLFAYQGYFLPINRFEPNVFFHKHELEIFEKQTLAKIRQKDFIDAGGFIGDSAIIFEREFCDKNIYTFEPTKRSHERILQTIKLNNSKRVIPVNKGLGAKNMETQVGITRNDGMASSMIFKKGTYITETETIQITTLDDFVRENQIEVGFIKVDIEGAEMQFLEGAKETICRQKPAMLISIYHQPSDFFKIKPLIESWRLGYRFKIHKKADFTLLEETVLFCEVLD